MKVEYKSMFLGIFAGIVGVFIILFVLGNVETKFSFTTGDPNKKKDKNINVSIDEINNLSINLYAQDSITTELYDKASFSITQEETLPFINFPDEELPTRSPSQERQERGFSTVAINPRLFIGLVRSDNTSLAATGGLFGNQLGDDDEY